MLNVDVYMVPGTASYTDYEILYTGFRPKTIIFVGAINSSGKYISVIIQPSGIIKISTNEASGDFNLRMQVVLV